MIDYIIPFFFLASGTVANRLILNFWSPSLLVGIRMLISGISLLSVALYLQGFDFIKRFAKQWYYLLFLAALATLVPAFLKAYAYKHTLSSKVALINSLDPFFTAFYMYLIFGEKLSTKKWLGIAIAFSASIFFALATNKGSTHELLGGLSLAELAAFGTVCFSRIGWIKVQELLKSGAFNVKEINGICMFFAGVYSLILTGIFAPHDFVIAADWSSPAFWKTLGFLLYTIVAGNIIGYSLYSRLLKHHSATFVSLAGFTTPVFIYLLSWLVMGEPLYPSFIIASAITFVGVLIFYHAEIKEALKSKENF